jgi:hypothetical protein
MNETPLHRALDWWARQDDMGGFKTAAATLFPGWEPKRSCRAPHREDKAASFSVYSSERGEFRFKDFAGDQGGLVGFVMLAGMDEKTAARWLMEKAGIATGQHISCARQQRNPESKPRELSPLPVMPAEAMAAWIEGVDHLQAKRGRVEGLATFRGWPVEFAQYLSECAIVSMPLYHRHRTIAFLVAGPKALTNPLGGRIIMRDVGFHCRLKPGPTEAKATWRFVPNKKEHKQTTPGLPFIIGGSWFDSARLLIITEGQWDALTFALAAGWLGEGRSWPEGACVVGIRGASGDNTFLQYYRPFWPANINCLLLPDSDGTGGRWFDGRHSFADRLAQLCRKVAVVRCGEHKDFNDLYRAEKVTPEQIGELLAAHGMALESGVTG